jgi:hypothetical protein
MTVNQAAEKPGTVSFFGKFLCSRCAVDPGGGGCDRGGHFEMVIGRSTPLTSPTLEQKIRRS